LAPTLSEVSNKLLLTAGIADVWAWSFVSPVKMMNKKEFLFFFEDYI
jgi:hypothetical protein